MPSSDADRFPWIRIPSGAIRFHVHQLGDASASARVTVQALRGHPAVSDRVPLRAPPHPDGPSHF
jgi:hypothetical protein